MEELFTNPFSYKKYKYVFINTQDKSDFVSSDV